MEESAKQTAAAHRTLEAYRSLLETEVKNLLQRVGTLTQTQDDLLQSVNDLAINLEEVVSTMERLETSRTFFREEIEELQRATKRNEEYSATLYQKLKGIQKRLQQLEVSTKPVTE